MPVILGVALILVVVIIINYAQNILQNRVLRSTAKLAAALGLSFSKEQHPVVPGVPGDFLLFAQGMPFSRKNVVEGIYKEVDLAVFNYSFTKDWGKMQELFEQTVIHVRSLQHPLPHFTLYPQEHLNAVMNNLPTQDGKDKLLETAGIKLPNHPDFRDKYKLMGVERQKLVAIFDNESVVKAVRSINTKPYGNLMCLEGAGNNIFIYPLYKRVSVKKLIELLDKCLELIKHLESVTDG